MKKIFFFIPAILLSPIGGIVADRVNKRNIMVILDFFTAAVILAIFIVSFALGAETKLQITILFRTPTDSTFVPGRSHLLFHFLSKYLTPAHLSGTYTGHIPGGQEKYNDIQ